MKRHISGVMVFLTLLVIAAGCSYESNPVNTDNPRAAMRVLTLTAPALGDRVWYDVDMDGLQGDTINEFGIADVVVKLYDCAVVDTGPTLLNETMTDAGGYYFFDSLAPGEYSLRFEAPSGYVFTGLDQGDDMLDSDADQWGWTVCITLDSTEINVDIDAGMYMVDTVEGAIIGDRVWDDTDMNGIQGDEIDEPGLEGVNVYLYDCLDSLLAGTVTDENGNYYFSGVAAGEYYLMFELPDGYLFSLQNIGPNDWLDSDADPATGKTACFVVAEDVVYTFWDAGMHMPVDEGCTRSKGYWKNHAGFGPQADMVTDLLPIWLGEADADKSLAVTDAQIAVDVLSMHTYGHPSNGITKLYAQLLAAKLNIAAGASPMDISDIINDADGFLADYDWMDWETLDRDQMKMVLNWMGTLDDYNNGEVGPGYCGDDDDHDYDHDGDNDDDDNQGEDDD